MSTWRKAYSVSPPTDERRSRRTISRRSRACRRSSTRKRLVPPLAASAPTPTTLPRPAAPAAAALEQLRARRADDQHRHAARPVDQVVDEIEHLVVGPVQILEDQH